MHANILKQNLNLTIAHPKDSQDTDFNNSDILLAKDIVKLAGSGGSQDVTDLKKQVDTINNEITEVKDTLDDCVKSNGATFDGVVYFDKSSNSNLNRPYFKNGTLYVPNIVIYGNDGIYENKIMTNKNPSTTEVFNTKGGTVEIGENEIFTFTLEDGTRIEKTIKVINTTQLIN